MRKFKPLLMLVVMLLVAMSITNQARAERIIPEEIEVGVYYNTKGVTAKAAINNKLGVYFENTYGIEIQSVSCSSAFGDVIQSPFTAGYAIKYNDGTEDRLDILRVNIEPVSPSEITLVTTNLDPISEISDQYASESSFLNYVNSDLKADFTYDTSGYIFVVGSKLTTVPRFDMLNSDIEFQESVANDTKYTFSNTYMDCFYKRTVTVTHHDRNRVMPKISVNYTTKTLENTDADMEYSIDGGSTWKKCTNNMKIESTMFEHTMIIYYPESRHYNQSEKQTLYIPYEATAPTVAPKILPNSRTAIITNCDDLINTEFSLNATDWYSTTNSMYTFRDLAPQKNYVVYYRTKGNTEGSNTSKYWFPSTNKTVGFSTLRVPTNDTVVANKYDTKNRIAYVDAILTAATTVKNNNVNTTLTDSSFNKLVNAVDKALNNQSGYSKVISKLDIDVYKEVITDEAYNTVVNIPLNVLRTAIENANLSIVCNTEYGSAELSNRTLSNVLGKNNSPHIIVSIENVVKAPSSSSLSYVKSAINSDRPVYKVSSKYNGNGMSTTYRIPYVLKDSESLGAIDVYLVDTKGNKTSIGANYNAANRSFEFTTSKDGYVVIANDGYYFNFPFVDVDTNRWSYNYVAYCYRNGIFAGTSATTFTPASDISNGMIYTLLARMIGVDTNERPTSSTYEDVKVTDWYAPGAEWAKKIRLVNGNEFNPDESMKRANIALTIYKYIGYIGIDGSTYIKDDIYTDVSKDDKSIKSDVRSAIAWCYENGIMVGVSSTEFSPNSYVSREQMAAILTRLDQLIE